MIRKKHTSKKQVWELINWILDRGGTARAYDSFDTLTLRTKAGWINIKPGQFVTYDESLGEGYKAFGGA